MLLQIEESRGLCSTCNNAPSCFYHHSRGPALFCELFDNYVSPGVQTFAAGAPQATVPLFTSNPALEEAAEYTGLCMNCENRQTCGHAKSEGGVWHCEDYR